MPTANVNGTYSGSTFTIDVTACNLDPNVAIADFIVLHNGNKVTNNLGYTKTTPTILTYSGTALPSTSVTVFRNTPVSQVQSVTYGARFSSALWNSEVDRNVRWKEEAQLNGKGPNSTVIVPLPNDAAFGSGWSGDSTFPPTRNAVYNWGTTLAPLASPAFTGTPTVPTPSSAVDKTLTIANTTWVQNFVSASVSSSPTISNPTINGGMVTGTVSGNPTFNGNPIFTGNPTFSGNAVFSGIPTVPTVSATDSTGNAASTAFVYSAIASALSGNYSQTSTMLGTTAMSNTTRADATSMLATTLWVQRMLTVGSNYLQLGNGLLIQWGAALPTLNSSSAATIPFNRSFSSASGVIALAVAANNYPYPVTIIPASLGVSNFGIQVGTSSSVPGATVGIYWVAFGPGAAL